MHRPFLAVVAGSLAAVSLASAGASAHGAAGSHQSDGLCQRVGSTADRFDHHIELTAHERGAAVGERE